MSTNVALPLNVYGYAEVQTDGTTIKKSPNVAVSRTGPGVYLITPTDKFDSALFVLATILNGVPFIASPSAVGNGNVQVSTFNATTGAAADAHFSIVLFSIGEELSSVPAY